MNIEWVLITSFILLILGLSLIIFGQSKKINVLKVENQKLRPKENNDELIALVREKLETLGVVKTVKYLREHRGMSMVDAKQLVDTFKN